MRRNFRILLAISLAFYFVPAARACSCYVDSLSPCRTLTINKAMFVGEVLTVREARSQSASGNLPSHAIRVFSFRVIESFTTSPHTGDEVEVQTGFGGGDCGYPFEVGQRYLIDAYDAGAEESVRLGTGICTMTALESQAAVTIAELRTRVSGGRMPDLSGQVFTVEGIAQSQLDETKPLASIAVTITSQTDGTTLHTTTDTSGIYTVPALPPDTYRIDFDLPPRRVPMQIDGDQPVTVTIPYSAGTGANCHINMPAAPSGSISGQFVDPSGGRVAGWVSAYPVTQSGRLSSAASVGTDPQGRFTLRFLRDGDYRIEFSRGIAGKDMISNVTVRDGKATTGVQFTVPAQ